MSILCKLVGHKWREFVRTGTKVVPEETFTGLGISGITETVKYTGFYRQWKNCLRCGDPNPNFVEEDGQKTT